MHNLRSSLTSVLFALGLVPLTLCAAETVKTVPPRQTVTVTINGFSLHEVIKSAKAGNSVAEFELGMVYLHGWGVPANAYDALKWLSKAASHGNIYAADEMGKFYYEEAGPNHDEDGDALSEAVECFRQSANAGNPDAQVRLGFLYARGIGVPRDRPEAVEWWEKAAQQGNATAQFCLGVSYGLGRGVKKDPAVVHQKERPRGVPIICLRGTQAHSNSSCVFFLQADVIRARRRCQRRINFSVYIPEFLAPRFPNRWDRKGGLGSAVNMMLTELVVIGLALDRPVTAFF